MLILQGSIDTSMTLCPSIMMGTFSYTFNNVANCSESEVDICTDKYSMTFNYNKCAQQMAFSVGGEVRCLHHTAVNSGSTMLHVYNMDTNTDEMTSYRFSCYIIQYINGIVYATQHPQDCLIAQTSTAVTSPGMEIVFWPQVTCATPCTYPAELRGTWLSSFFGTLDFQESHFSPLWNLKFMCHSVNGTYYVSRSQITYINGQPSELYICWDLTMVSSTLYSYNEATSKNSGTQTRVKIYLSGQMTTHDDVCDVANPPATSHSMLMKAGSIGANSINCPEALVGNFEFDEICSPGSKTPKMTICQNPKMMTFNDTDCDKERAYSAGGEMQCVYSKTVGLSSVLHVYNMDTSTDETATFRFTCFVVRYIQGLVYVTQHPRDCEASQTHTSVQSPGLAVVLKPQATCTVPCDYAEDLQGSWLSSYYGSITVNKSHVTGLDISGIGNFTFMCDTRNSSRYISRSEVFYLDGLPSEAFLCWDIENITSTLFKYYQATSRYSQNNTSRVKVFRTGVTVGVSDVCDVTDYTQLSYSLLVKADSAENNTISCPHELVGTFDFTFDAGNDSNCNVIGNDTVKPEVSVCSDKTKMIFNNTQCMEQRGFSDGGILQCVYASQNGTTTYLHTYNTDSTTDNNSTYRFTCFTLHYVNGLIHITQHPRDCLESQTPTTVDSPGSVLVLLPRVTCSTPCLYPGVIRGSWLSSFYGPLTIEESQVSNITFKEIGSLSFMCDVTNGTSYVSRSEVFYKDGLPSLAYFCWDFQQKSSSLYTYYQPTSTKYKIYRTGAAVTMADICDVTDYSQLAYGLLMKSNSLAQNTIQCPEELLGTFDLEFSSGNDSVCSANNDTKTPELSVCGERTKMVFNQTDCEAQKGYSERGVLQCIYREQRSGMIFLHAYNLDTNTNENATYRFTCFVIEYSNGLIHATQHPQDCLFNQTTTYVESPGAALILKPRVTCATPCTYPGALRGLWVSSHYGSLTFGESEVSNITFSAIGSLRFMCDVTYNTKYVSRSEVFYHNELPSLAYFCWDFKVISSTLLSYHQPTSGGIRIYRTGQSVNMTNICDITDYSQLSYSLMMKSGTLANNTINCPDEIIGTFDYEFIGGSGNMCGQGNNVAQMSVCSDKTMMAFNNTDCRQQKAYSNGGELQCVHTEKTNNTTVLYVYNLDTTTDEKNTYRFSCFVMKYLEGLIYLTHHPRDCLYNQSHTSVESPGAAFLLKPRVTCATACTYPTELRGSWSSSRDGLLEFNETQFSSLAVDGLGSFTFSCDTEINNTYISRSDIFYLNNLPTEVFLCWDLTKETIDRFIYYTPTAMYQGANSARIKVYRTGKTKNASEICDVTDYSTLTYSLLVNNEFLRNSTEACPDMIHGSFLYQYEASDSCPQADNLELGVTGDLRTMTFKNAQCNEHRGYSVGGKFQCLRTTITNQHTILYAYNLDNTTDENTTYRYVCYIISNTTNGKVYITQYPKECTKGQNITVVPSPGAALVLTREVQEEESVSLSTAGTVSVSLVAILAVLFGFLAGFLIRRHYKRKRERASDEKTDINDTASEYIEDSITVSDETGSIQSDASLGLPDESDYDIEKLNYNPNDILTSRNVKATFQFEDSDCEIAKTFEEDDASSDSDEVDRTSIEALEVVRELTKEEKERIQKVQNEIYVKARGRELDEGGANTQNGKRSQKPKNKLKQLAKRRSALSQLTLKSTKSTKETGPTTVDEESTDEGNFSSLTTSSIVDFDDEQYYSESFDDESDDSNCENSRATEVHYQKIDGEPQLSASTSPKRDAEGSSSKLHNKVRSMGVLAKKRMRKIVMEIRNRKTRPRKNKTCVRERSDTQSHIENLSETDEEYDNFSVNSFPPDGSTIHTPSYFDDTQSADEISTRHRRRIKVKSAVDEFDDMSTEELNFQDETSGNETKVVTFKEPKGFGTHNKRNRRRFPSSVSSRTSARSKESFRRFPPTPGPSNNWVSPSINASQNPETPVDDDEGSADESTWKMIRKNMPEEKWKSLLEELYKDKKYFDRIQGSATDRDNVIMGKTEQALQYLYRRAEYWDDNGVKLDRPPVYRAKPLRFPNRQSSPGVSPNTPRRYTPLNLSLRKTSKPRSQDRTLRMRGTARLGARYRIQTVNWCQGQMRPDHAID